MERKSVKIGSSVNSYSAIIFKLFKLNLLKTRLHRSKITNLVLLSGNGDGKTKDLCILTFNEVFIQIIAFDSFKDIF